jgi:hypothetical protein
MPASVAALNYYYAFRWTTDGGAIPLQRDFYTPSEWTHVYGMSSDGLTIVGNAYDALGMLVATYPFNQ